jgi:molybdopterin converting factor small subunit
MKVRLIILLPGMIEAIGSKEVGVEFVGKTINDLIKHLVALHGKKASKALHDKDGELDPLIQILLNGEKWIPHDQLDTVLQDGDFLMFAMMMAGG